MLGFYMLGVVLINYLFHETDKGYKGVRGTKGIFMIYFLVLFLNADI